jgi:predicted Zn-dependent peptidase
MNLAHGRLGEADLARETVIQTVLSNGLRVHLKQLRHQRTITLGMFISHGSQFETINTSGSAHFIEHILFNPKHMVPKQQVQLEVLLDHGAKYEAFTSKEYTRFTVACTQDMIEHAMSFMSTLMEMSATISPAAVDHERPIILHEHAMTFGASSVLRDVLEHAFWGDRMLGLYVIGRKENIEKFSQRDLASQYAEHYGPQRCTLVILGNIELDMMDKLVERHFDHLPGNTFTRHSAACPQEPRAIAVPTGGNRCDLLLGLPGYTFCANERFAMELLADVLGGGLTSRLFVRLREQMQKVYSIHAFPVTYGLGGYVGVQVNCQRQDLQAAMTAILEEFDRLRSEEVSERELSRAKATRKTATLGVLENTAQHAQMFGRRAVLNDCFYVDSEIRGLDRVTQADLLDISRAVLRPDDMALAAFGPSQDEVLHLMSSEV